MIGQMWLILIYNVSDNSQYSLVDLVIDCYDGSLSELFFLGLSPKVETKLWLGLTRAAYWGLVTRSSQQVPYSEPPRFDSHDPTEPCLGNADKPQPQTSLSHDLPKKKRDRVPKDTEKPFSGPTSIAGEPAFGGCRQLVHVLADRHRDQSSERHDCRGPRIHVGHSKLIRLNFDDLQRVNL